MLGTLELLVEDDILAGKQECGGQEVVLIRLFLVVLLVECSLIFLQVFVEHVLSAELVPASEMVDLHMRQYAMLFKDPVDLFLLAPDSIPVLVPGLLPLSVLEGIIDAVFEGGLKLDVGAASEGKYGGFG